MYNFILFRGRFFRGSSRRRVRFSVAVGHENFYTWFCEEQHRTSLYTKSFKKHALFSNIFAFHFTQGIEQTALRLK